MAVVVGIVDSDPERRRQFIQATETHVASYGELTRHRWDHADLTLLAAAADSTPVEHAHGRNGFTWIMGDVYSAENRSPATFITTLIETSGSLALHGQSGYYLACTVEVSGRVTLGTDILGMFPLYYWSDGKVLLFSTLPGLIHRHPNFRKRISAEGLAGILVQSHMVNCQTIWEGIRRPEPGHALQWQAGTTVRTVPANPLQATEEHFGLEYGRARQLFNANLHSAVTRCARGSRQGMMLSGGMDSRLVAAHLHTLRPGATTAFVFGDSGDNEFRCARGVAKTLGMPTLRLPARFECFQELALAVVEEEHMSNTFHDFTWLSGREGLKAHCRELLNGFFGDAVMGGSQIRYAYDHRRGVYDFDGLFANNSVWGFAPEEISFLVKAMPLAEATASCVEKMRATFDALPGLPFQKATLWSLYHRCRYHVGPYIWRLSKYVWPVMPYLDRTMLETCLGMPLDYLGQRRIQVDTLKSDYRHLALLPLDCSSFDTRPLIETRTSRAKRMLSRWRRKLLPDRTERRTYHRVFDINNPGWRAIRQLASTRQASAYRLFNPEALRKYILSPEEKIICADAITNSARLKTLVGLMLLSEQLTE